MWPLYDSCIIVIVLVDQQVSPQVTSLYKQVEQDSPCKIRASRVKSHSLLIPLVKNWPDQVARHLKWASKQDSVEQESRLLKLAWETRLQARYGKQDYKQDNWCTGVQVVIIYTGSWFTFNSNRNDVNRKNHIYIVYWCCGNLIFLHTERIVNFILNCTSLVEHIWCQ